MVYYDLSSAERKKLFARMEKDIFADFSSGRTNKIKKYASDPDTYIRKNCYLILGRLYKTDEKIREQILAVLDSLSASNDERIRRTAVYSLGEIGKTDFPAIEKRLNAFLADAHHSVKNGLTGALKQLGEKNPEPTFSWAKGKMKKCNEDMKKRILHGLELRGRTHPEDLLPILEEILRDGTDQKTKKMIVHIIGQISYKKGCLEKVVAHLKSWDDKEFLADCEKEIIKVHKSYEKFSAYNPVEAKRYLAINLWGCP